jgi:hypothetical protein
MEYAAGLLGTTVNCTELMRAGEVGDEEASAASAALTVLREIWGSSTFTARDVVKTMMPESKIGTWPASGQLNEAEMARAESISDALGELVGKRLDRPTAHSIGKLFQKRLVGRPAWIGDGQTVATLRKSPGHNENTYRVELSAPGRGPKAPSSDTGSSACPGQGHPPHSPHSPCWSSSAMGNKGKEGKAFTATAGDSASSPDANGTTPGWMTRI